MKKKIFLTGASGKLGSTLIPYLEKNYKLFSVGFKKKPVNGFNLDLTKESKVKIFLNKARPDIIIHLAALTNVDLCEKNYQKAYDINCITTKNLINWTKKNNCRFIYLSTDQIYNNSGFNKENNPCPQNSYSLTKYIAEKIVLFNKDSVIIRTNFFGIFPNHNGSLLDWFFQSIKKKKRIKLIKDIHFNPLYVDQLCFYILEIIKNKRIKGIINLGAKNGISKGKLLFNISKKLGIKKFSFSYENFNKLNLTANRPKNMIMNVTKIEKLLNKPMPKIKDCINKLAMNINYE